MAPEERSESPPPLEPLPPGMVENLSLEDSNGEAVEHIQTHISHVLLTATRVYKIRKAVHFPFVDFSTRTLRNRDCVSEVELNRRLSPSVYLGVAPIEQRGTGWHVGPIDANPSLASMASESAETCVVMRRLPDGMDAQQLLLAGRLANAQVDLIADRVADFHDRHRLGAPAPWSPEEWFGRASSVVIETLELIIESAPDESFAERARALKRHSQERLEENRGALEARRVAGLAVDGHGDLQLAHIWFEDLAQAPQIIDCTEFNEGFRRIDAASEVAFLAMDLVYRGRGDLAEHFLSHYARETDDFHLFSVVDDYASYRAAVRAKVALLALHDPDIGEPQRSSAHDSAVGHLELAERLCAPRPRGVMIVLCGIIGSGKSTLARHLREALPAVVVSSDRTRKHMAGLASTDRQEAEAEPLEGLYSTEQSDAVYAGILERASWVVDSGRCAILDAGFWTAVRREQARAHAGSRGIQVILVEARCSQSVILERLSRRERQDRDPSDAGPDLYDFSEDRYEPPNEWPERDLIVVQTDSPDWQARLSENPRLSRLNQPGTIRSNSQR